MADVLRDEREVILDEWEAAVRDSGSQSASFARADLCDDIPAFLDRLVAWLRTGSNETREAVECKTTGRHALHRLEHGVELRHLIHEYRLLRQVLLRHLLRHGVVDELQRDWGRLADAIDHAMTESVATYAKARDEAREMMLAVLSHDLRNPLTAITLASAAMLKSGRLNPVEARSVSRIARAADRIRRMISDLLDLARSRFGGRIPVKREWLDLAEVVHNTMDELVLAHPERRVTFESHGDVRGCWDRGRMAQLASNLVSNALRHGSDPISVAVIDRGGAAEVRVCNRGAAIPPEQIASMFQPYRRGHHSDPAGLGLGLLIVAEIVRAHGGDMSVRSDEAATEFIVSLPKSVPEETAASRDDGATAAAPP